VAVVQGKLSFTLQMGNVSIHLNLFHFLKPGNQFLPKLMKKLLLVQVLLLALEVVGNSMLKKKVGSTSQILIKAKGNMQGWFTMTKSL